MKRQIVVEIDPHDNGTPDGFCAYVEHGVVIHGCSEWDDGYCSLFRENCSLLRCNRCLAAERKLAALLAAGSDLCFSPSKTHESRVEAWDSALAALKVPPA